MGASAPEMGVLPLADGFDATAIYAYGTSLRLEASEDGTGTLIYDADDHLLSIYGLTANADGSYDLSSIVIVGGWASGTRSGDTSITMNGGIVGGIIGGNVNASRTCDSHITINGGTVKGLYQHVPYAEKFSFIGGSYSMEMGNPVSQTGSAYVTINGGTIEGAGYMANAGNYESANATIENAYLNITGGTFGSDANIYGGGTINHYGTKENVSYTGKLYINVQNKGSLAVAAAYWISPTVNVPEDKYIITDSTDYFNQRAIYGFSLEDAGTHTIRIDTDTKTYTMKADDTVETGAAMEIPEGYTLDIPEGVTVIVPEGETLTNHGAITIRGTLVNNGTITDSGSILLDGGTFSGANPSSGAVQSVADAIESITLEAGTTRATTRLKTLTAPEGSNQQYYKVYNLAPTLKSAGEVIDISSYTQITTTPTAEIPAPLNGCLEVCETDTENKVQKCSQVTVSADVLRGNHSYDALSSDIVSYGVSENTTKITAAPEEGNRLYYRLTAAAPTDTYYYNSSIDITGWTEVSYGEDISAAKGQYLSVYEVNEDNLLRKYLCVELTLSNMTLENYGLICDAANKRIFCNGRTVRLSYSVDYLAGIQLYVYENESWVPAIPSGMPFEEGSFKGYTLYGGSGLEDEGGTCLIEYMDGSGCPLSFERLPSAIQNFSNYITPDLETDTKAYTVKGTIDLNLLHSTKRDFESILPDYSYSEDSICMTSLTLLENARLTTATTTYTGECYSSNSITLLGTADQIVLGAGAEIIGEQNIIFQPQIDIRLYRADGTEYPKKEGVYQLAPNKPLTIAAAFSTDHTPALLSVVPESTTVSPIDLYNAYRSSFADVYGPPPMAGYFIDFVQKTEKRNHRYYAQDDINLQKTLKNGKSVVTAALTIDDITSVATTDRMLYVSCYRLETTESPETRFTFNSAFVEYEYTKAVQDDITTNLKDRYPIGTEPFSIGAVGGTVSVNEPFIYESSNPAVASIDSEGNLSILSAGKTTIKVSKAGDENYEPVTYEKEITVYLTLSPFGELSDAQTQNPDNPAAVGYATVTMKKTSFVYTGSGIRPTVSVKYTYMEYDANGEKSGKAKTKKLKENVDYTVTYENATAVAGADSTTAPRVILTGRGDYEGVITKTFAITPKNIKSVKAEQLPDFVSTGSDLAEKIKAELVLLDGVNVVSPSDYDVAFSEAPTGSAEADTKLTLTITAKEGGNYTGTMKQKPTVVILAQTEGKTDLSAPDAITVTFKQDFTKKPLTYNGKGQKPAVVIKTADGKKLATKNYKLIYENNVNAGENTATVTIVGKNQYYGSKTVSFSILPKDFSKVKVSGLYKLMFQKTITDLNPLVKDGKTVLTKDVDYTLSTNEIASTGFLKKNTMTVEMTFTPTAENANYVAGTSKVMKVTLTKRNINNRFTTTATLSASSVTLNNDPSVTVTCYGEKLIEGTDYTVTYKNNQKAGNAKAIITGIGAYSGKRTLKYRIME